MSAHLRKRLSWYLFFQTSPNSRAEHKLQPPKGEASPIAQSKVKMPLETNLKAF